jgi:hypothetical protein
MIEMTMWAEWQNNLPQTAELLRDSSKDDIRLLANTFLWLVHLVASESELQIVWRIKGRKARALANS